MTNGRKKPNKFRMTDLLVILICLTGVAYSVNLFRHSLFQTLNGQNKESIGTVIVKRNTVQRRMSDRVLWDRLVKKSPVYSGDIIRVADNSEADLHVGNNELTLNENTLVRLHYDKETGEYKIDLSSGNMGLVTATEGGNVSLSVMGKKVEAKPGTALNASAGNDGIALQVSKGSASIEGQERGLTAGNMIAMDIEGAIRTEPAVMVIQPQPNALYRKSEETLNVVFSWNRINIQPDETLRLEIAADQSFSKSVRALNGLNSSAQAALGTGVWYWRIMFNTAANGGNALANGRFTIADISNLQLLSPARNQQFFYETELPKLYFQWSGVQDVSSYLVEVDVTPEFRNPVIKKQTTITSFSDSSLNEGIWYWRVTPVFSDNAKADPRVSAFRIVKNNSAQTSSAMQSATASQSGQVVAKIGEDIPLVPVLQSGTIPQLEPVQQPAPVPQPETKIVYVPVPAPAPEPKIIYVPSEPKIVYVPAPAQETAKTPEPSSAVQTVSRLPAPSNRQPVEGYRIGFEDVKKETITFRWSAVSGANAYLFTIYQETNGTRRQITQIGPENRTTYTMDIVTLGRGNFIWRVEAVNVGKDNVIERHGDPGENHFVVDIPRAGQPEVRQ